MAWNAHTRYAPQLPGPGRGARAGIRRRWLRSFAVLVLLLAGAGLTVWYLSATSAQGSRIARGVGKVIQSMPLSQFLPDVKATLLDLVLFCPYFYMGVLLIFALEWLFPVERKQKLLSVGLAHDVVWLFLQAVFAAATEVTYVYLLIVLYRRYLGFLTVRE